MNTNRATFIGVLAIGLIAFPLNAQEHPSEHPSEHPTTKKAVQKASVPITKDNLAEAIAAYVNEQSGKDMQFTVKDEQTGKELKLKLIKVHKDRLSSVGDDTYFACADFKADDGETYDLDVFMKGKSAEKLTFDKFMVHKENNVERYTWVKEDGTWKQKPVKEVPPEE